MKNQGGCNHVFWRVCGGYCWVVRIGFRKAHRWIGHTNALRRYQPPLHPALAGRERVSWLRSSPFYAVFLGLFFFSFEIFDLNSIEIHCTGTLRLAGGTITIVDWIWPHGHLLMWGEGFARLYTLKKLSEREPWLKAEASLATSGSKRDFPFKRDWPSAKFTISQSEGTYRHRSN